MYDALRFALSCFQNVCLNFCFGVIIFLVIFRYLIQQFFTNKAGKCKYIMSG